MGTMDARLLPHWLRNSSPEIYLSDNYVVLDFETTNKSKGSVLEEDNSIVLSAYKVGTDHKEYTGVPVACIGNQFHQDRLMKAIESADFIVAQNTKFELQWLTRCGLKLETVLPFDTMLAKYVQNGNRRTPLDLDSIAATYSLGKKMSSVSKLIKFGVCPSQIPVPMLRRYCVQDVLLTEQIFLKQRQELLQDGLLAVAFTRNIFTPVLADIEMTGMQLDSEQVLDYFEEYSRVHANVLEQLNTFSEEVNWNSPNQVAEFVYEGLKFKELEIRGSPIRNKPNKRFPNGAPKTDTATLSALVATNKRQRIFTDLYARNSKLKKSLTTYLALFKTSVLEKGGMLYGKFNQAITQTHRLSSSQPEIIGLNKQCEFRGHL